MQFFIVEKKYLPFGARTVPNWLENWIGIFFFIQKLKLNTSEHDHADLENDF